MVMSENFIFYIYKEAQQPEYSAMCLPDTEPIQHYDSVYLDINLWSLRHLILISFVRYKLRKPSASGDPALYSSLKETEHRDRQTTSTVCAQAKLRGLLSIKLVLNMSFLIYSIFKKHNKGV
jgi:hypothetical protein